MARILTILLLLGLVFVFALVVRRDGRSMIPSSAQRSLENADQFELFSIDPDPGKEQSKDDFHLWKVLGRTTIKDADIRNRLVDALKKGAAETDGIVLPACFNPRHGIRATYDGKTIDFVICFECFQVDVYANEKRDGGFRITRSPQPVFDQVLRDSAVPLAEAAKK